MKAGEVILKDRAEKGWGETLSVSKPKKKKKKDGNTRRDSQTNISRAVSILARRIISRKENLRMTPSF